jgi:hypothetical protein
MSETEGLHVNVAFSTAPARIFPIAVAQAGIVDVGYREMP